MTVPHLKWSKSGVAALWFLLGLLFFSRSSVYAVIGGTPAPVSEVSTLELKISHKVWSGRDGRYVMVFGTCSSVIVGLHPLTLLTVSHCFRDPDIDEGTNLPKLEINNLGQEPTLRLKTALYEPIVEVNKNGMADIAVLVFEGSADSSWKPLPIAKTSSADRVRICGFGYSAKEGPLTLPRCAVRETVADLLDFSQFVPAGYQNADAGLFALFEAQFASKAERFSSMDRIVGVNRLDNGIYSLEIPMPRKGDSGGPWFSMDEHGNLSVFALTSFGETFYRKNKTWPVFSDPSVPTDDLPYAFYGVKLFTAEAQAIFRKARDLGADL